MNQCTDTFLVIFFRPKIIGKYRVISRHRINRHRSVTFFTCPVTDSVYGIAILQYFNCRTRKSIRLRRTSRAKNSLLILFFFGFLGLALRLFLCSFFFLLWRTLKHCQLSGARKKKAPGWSNSLARQDFSSRN